MALDKFEMKYVNRNLNLVRSLLKETAFKVMYFFSNSGFLQRAHSLAGRSCRPAVQVRRHHRARQDQLSGDLGVLRRGLDPDPAAEQHPRPGLQLSQRLFRGLRRPQPQDLSSSH